MSADKKYDVCIVGAGFSGLVLAIKLARAGLLVCLVELNRIVGRRILSTGNGRCNFTKAHEAGHQILKMLFPKEYGGDNRKLHFCLAQPPKQRKMDWLEWQANAIASVILMPKEVIMRALFLFGFGERIEMINKVYATWEYERFSSMAVFLGVSKTALSIRLTQLGLVDKNYFGNPYDLTDIYCDGGI